MYHAGLSGIRVTCSGNWQHNLCLGYNAQNMPFARRNCTIITQSSAVAYAIDANLMLTMSLYQHSA